MTTPDSSVPDVTIPDITVPDVTVPGINVEHVLTQIIQQGASDLHLKTGSPPMARIRGEIRRFGAAPLSAQNVRDVFEHVASDAGRQSLLEHGEADFAYALRNVGRLRINAYQQQSGLTLVMRYVRNEVPDFRALGLPENVMTYLAGQHQGIVLVTGPTGSGKTTTLASLIQLINQTRPANIITIEDPIEVVYQDARATISQRELGRDTKSFARALRAALRQDPDIILIGEMRDKETVEAALSAAQTGHLVLSTLHTQDAVRTINRILDFFAPHERAQIRMALSESMVGIMSQRLVPSGGARKLCQEIMIATPFIRDQLSREGGLSEIKKAMIEDELLGMKSFDQHLATMVISGEMLEEEAVGVSTSAQELGTMLLKLRGV